MYINYVYVYINLVFSPLKEKESEKVPQQKQFLLHFVFEIFKIFFDPELSPDMYLFYA